MGMFSNNQIRHFYVANNPEAEIITKEFGDGGEIIIGIKNGLGEVEPTPFESVPDPNHEGAILRGLVSDNAREIDVKGISLMDSTTTLDEEVSADPVAGESYRIKLVVDQAFCDSPESAYVKVASVKAVSGMTAEQLYTKLAAALTKSIGKRDVAAGLFTITGSASGVKITINPAAVTKGFVAGISSIKPVLFHVECGQITVNGETDTWGSTEYGSTGSIKNGYKVAEMEYFYHGERGDIYRGMGYPNTVTTKLKAIPDAEYKLYEYDLTTDSCGDYNASSPVSKICVTVAIKDIQG